MSNMIVLLAGIPATGKSFFGHWLAENRHFVHLDIENSDRLQELSTAVRQNGVATFVDKLGQLGQRVVLDWGFPPRLLYFVKEMKECGVRLWWFDGDHDRAREEFIKRGTVLLPNFERQMHQIGLHWNEIREVFQPNILQVLDSEGHRMTPEEIWGHISTNAD
jgi:hypothetical protein